MKIEIEYLEDDYLESARCLLSGYEFNDYRNYRVLKKENTREYIFKHIREVLSNDRHSSVIIARIGEDVVGLALLRYLPWDSRHFNFNISEITHLVAESNYKRSYKIKINLLDFILSLCRKNKVRHIACKLDTGDLAGIHALEEKGFKNMDTVMTYIFNRFNFKIPRLKELYKVRAFKKKDLDALLKIAENSFVNSRFYRDIYFEKEDVDRLYGEWIKSYCNHSEYHTVLVAERDNKVTGFLGYRKKKELERLLGAKILGSGLSAVLPVAKGAYPLLIQAALDPWVVLDADISEWDTQLDNKEVIGIWQKLGARFVRSKHVFHKWLPIDA